jgi:hypothetical protein
MKEKRSAPGVATFGGKIFIIGGHNGSDALNSVTKFDPETNSWSAAAPTKEKRNAPGKIVYFFEFILRNGCHGT